MRIFRNIGETHGYQEKSMPHHPKRRKQIGRRAARREGNMADGSNETKENEVDEVQEPPEQPHDVECTWRRIALAVAAVVIVGSGLCIGKEAENANAGAANASAIANGNSKAKDSGDNGDEAYALTSPLPEERIAEKIDEVCPNETYVIKNRSVGTDTSGNPYADYECAVTSGRELVFEASALIDVPKLLTLGAMPRYEARWSWSGNLAMSNDTARFAAVLGDLDPRVGDPHVVSGCAM